MSLCEVDAWEFLLKRYCGGAGRIKRSDVGRGIKEESIKQCRSID